VNAIETAVAFRIRATLMVAAVILIMIYIAWSDTKYASRYIAIPRDTLR
jgi:hypothetical protein